jgi:hydrogenase maturation protein HypF
MSPMQHHYGHILACMADHQIQAPVLGIAWDGADSSSDRLTWGGEFLQIHNQAHNNHFARNNPAQNSNQNSLERVAHFLPYDLPGQESCILEPRRSAIGLLYSCYGEAAFEMSDLAPMQAFTKPQLMMLRKMLTHKINTSVTSSIGRMFDGIAALLNLHHYVSFEGQAALTLEFAATQSPVKLTYPFTLTHSSPCLIDWRPMLRAIVEDTREAVMTPVIAAKFHNTLVEIMVVIAQKTAQKTAHLQVVMAGSCFQNSVLIERAIRRLSAEGFTPYWPQRISATDNRIDSRTTDNEADNRMARAPALASTRRN